MNDNLNTQNSIAPDVIVIGGGIFGLWAARHAILRGERVLVLDKRQIGDGASGGFLGALMPHLPDFWEPKKQMQYEALRSLPDAINALEEDTGHDCGYRRCGRIMPLTHAKMPENATRRITGAKANWIDENGKQLFKFELIEPGLVGSIAEGWLNDDVAPFGATYDDFSARVNPRRYVRALAAFVRSGRHGLGQIEEGVEVCEVLTCGESVQVELRTGEVISAGRVMIANGWEAYSLLDKMGGSHLGRVITGRGVKGQAVLLDYPHDDQRPILYDNGSYIIPHVGNRIAIGSTSVDAWLPNGFGNDDYLYGARGKKKPLIHADHPERPASVEPAQNRAGFEDGPLPQFTELPLLAELAQKSGNVLATESFAGELRADDPLVQKLIEAARRSFDGADMGFYEHALRLCPSIGKASIVESWANVRPRNTVPHSITGKISTEPIFGALEDEERIRVAIGGFKISLGLAHLDN